MLIVSKSGDCPLATRSKRTFPFLDKAEWLTHWTEFLAPGVSQ